jgi:hypothetical protein
MTDQQKIDYAAARRPRVVSLREVERAQRLAAPPPPPTAEEQAAAAEEQARAVIAAAMRQIKDESIRAGIAAGLSVGRIMERNRTR